MRALSASEANRHFSRVLRDVAAGEVITVLSRGKPVATISPPAGMAGHSGAKASLLERLRLQAVAGERAWTRDELYD